MNTLTPHQIALLRIRAEHDAQFGKDSRGAFGGQSRKVYVAAWERERDKIAPPALNAGRLVPRVTSE